MLAPRIYLSVTSEWVRDIQRETGQMVEQQKAEERAASLQPVAPVVGPVMPSDIPQQGFAPPTAPPAATT